MYSQNDTKFGMHLYMLQIFHTKFGSTMQHDTMKLTILLAVIVQGQGVPSIRSCTGCLDPGILSCKSCFYFNCEISWSFVCKGCLITTHSPSLYDFKNTWGFSLTAVTFLWMNFYTWSIRKRFYETFREDFGMLKSLLGYNWHRVHSYLLYDLKM